MRNVLAALALCFLGILVSCGGGGGDGGGGQVSVTVSPTTATVIAEQTQQFTATVRNALNSTVNWSVSCSTSSCGTIDGNGLYTAPALIPSSITVTVRATSQEDTNIVGTATVTQQPVAVTVSPNTTQTLISAETKQFSATITNAPSGHTSYTWSVTGSGSIDSNGLYSAPSKVTADTTATVSVTSDFDNTKTASVSLALKAPVVSLSPGDTVLEGGGQLQFTPTVINVPTGQTGVSWELTGGGSIADGMYHAPTLVTTHQSATIKAISMFDNTKTAQSVVTMDTVTVVMSPKTATLYPTQTQQFIATVANHVNKDVDWTVHGTSCGGAGCGTIDSDGLYTAPNSISAEFSVNVTATSAADPSQSDSAALALKPITVTVTPETATVNVNGTRQFSATVQGGTNANVTWSVSGTGCTGSACGTINSSAGLYTAPGAIPVPPTVTVKATAVSDPSRSDTATVTIVNDPNVKLSGAYAFVYTGWDASSRALDAVGSFVADGAGHITGLIDMNGGNSAYRSLNQAFTGTYQVNPGEDRGAMTFNLPSGNRTFRFAIRATGAKGHFISFDATGQYGSGIFKKQTTSDFSLSSLNGDYAMGLAGLSAMNDERNAAVGNFHVDGAGGISATSLDIMSSGEPPAHMTFTGSVAMSAATGMSHGRGTFSVSVTGESPNFSFYLVDKDEAFMMRTDVVGEDAPLMTGGIMKQVGAPFISGAFNGNSVFYMTGLIGQPSMKPALMIGQFSLNHGNGTAAYTYNYGGSVSSGVTEIGATVYTNGRVLFSMVTGGYVAYLIGPNTGFIMEYNDPGTMVMFGFFEPQSAGPFDSGTLTGEFFGGALGAATGGVGYGNGIQNYNGNGAWSGTGNVAGLNNGLNPDVPVAGTYVFTDAESGAGDWLLTSSGTYHKKFYVVSPSKVVMIPTEESNHDPIVEIFEK